MCAWRHKPVLGCARREQTGRPAGEPSSSLGFRVPGVGCSPFSGGTIAVLVFQKPSWERDHLLDTYTHLERKLAQKFFICFS